MPVASFCRCFAWFAWRLVAVAWHSHVTAPLSLLAWAQFCKYGCVHISRCHSDASASCAMQQKYAPALGSDIRHPAVPPCLPPCPVWPPAGRAGTFMYMAPEVFRGLPYNEKVRQQRAAYPGMKLVYAGSLSHARQVPLRSLPPVKATTRAPQTRPLLRPSVLFPLGPRPLTAVPILPAFPRCRATCTRSAWWPMSCCPASCCWWRCSTRCARRSWGWRTRSSTQRWWVGLGWRDGVG